MKKTKRPKLKTIISNLKIRKKVKELGKKISRDYKNKKLVLVGVLKGAFVFLADLIREMNISFQLDFVQVSSYGASQTSSGIVTIKKDIDIPIVNKHVLIVEDIIDYGYTLEYLRKFFKNKGAASVKICVLLDKASRRKVDVPIAYCGFTVPDKFIVGYGLDFAEKFRQFSEIKNLEK